MEDWIGIAVVAAAGIIAYILSAVGCAALVFLWFPQLSRVAGAVLAGLPAPGMMALMVLIVALIDRVSPQPEIIFAVVAIIALPGFVIGWPFAFLALRALERRVERAGIKASEIFE